MIQCCTLQTLFFKPSCDLFSSYGKGCNASIHVHVRATIKHKEQVQCFSLMDWLHLFVCLLTKNTSFFLMLVLVLYVWMHGIMSSAQGVQTAIFTFLHVDEVCMTKTTNWKVPKIAQLLWNFQKVSFTIMLEHGTNVWVNSNCDHPPLPPTPPRAYPGHLTPVQLCIAGHLTQNQALET